MQKLFSLVIAAVMVAAGLVVGTGTAATAGDYTATVPTATIIDAPKRVERGDRARIGVRVTSESNRDPRGEVLLTVRKVGGGFSWSELKDYNGDKIWFRTPELRQRGDYIIRANYIPKPESRWIESRSFDELRVVRRG